MRGLNLRDEDAVIDARSAMADDQLVIISDQMSWKRVRLDEFNLKNRPLPVKWLRNGLKTTATLHGIIYRTACQ